MKSTLLTLSILLFLPFSGITQFYDLSEPDRINCGTAIVNNQRLKEDPSLKIFMDKQLAFAKAYEKSHISNKSGTILYTIPVVYHIIHNYGPENVSKADIEASIANLNEDFQKLNADTSHIVYAFTGIAADVQVQFRLAHIDPNGNCTEGITRTVSPLTYAMDNSVKTLVNWDTRKYLNIWVGQTIASGAGGYSYYPGMAPSQSQEGVVVRSAQMGNSITHEVGHFLNLPHLWGSSNTPGVASNCSIDDGINDTPLCIGAKSCNTALQTCGTLDNVQNYMEYSGCTMMFTQDQKTRMHAALNYSAGRRSSLHTASNLIATGTADPYLATVCAPIPDFSYSNEYICQGDYVSFTDDSYNAIPTSWNWTFTGGTPSSSSSSNPIITYNTPGVFSVTNESSTSAGSNSKTKTNIITVSYLTADYSGEVIESFENATTVNSDWIVQNNEGLGWEITPDASSSGSVSMMVNNYSNIDDNEIDVLISPSYDISNVPSKIMTFKQAFAKKTSADTDRLFVYYSINCGKSWALKLPISSSRISTVSSTQSSKFIPGPDDWVTRTVDLGYIPNATNVRFKFKFRSGGGNNIYIDDINIGGTVGVNDFNNIASFSVYPNPTSASAKISFNLVGNVKKMSIKVKNSIGQEVTSVVNGESFSSGKYTLKIDEQRKLASGIYFVEFNADNNIKVEKLIVQ